MSERAKPTLESVLLFVDDAKDLQPIYADGWDDLGRYAKFLASEGRIPSPDLVIDENREHRIISHKYFDFDVDGHSVVVQGVRVELTKMNFDLLNYLINRKNKVVSREILLDKVWENYASKRTVDVHVSKLRKILAGDRGNGLEIIRTVIGRGYMLYDENQDPNTQAA